MKFRVTMKDPDGFYESIQDSVDKLEFPGLDAEKLKEICRRWFEYSEYLTVEVDTEAMTCVVVEKGK